MQRWFIGLCTLAIIGFIFFEPSVGAFLGRLANGGDTDLDANKRLSAEVLALRAEIAQLSSVQELFRASSSDILPTFVFSRYPFNFKNEITIAVGSDEDIAIGQAVVMSIAGARAKPIFVGDVIRVFGDRAVARTIFDPKFQAAVRIGAKGVDALLVGGSEPHLTLIPKGAVVLAGDPVILVSADMPYGLAVGTLTEAYLAQDRVFQEAIITTPYDINTIQVVGVLRTPTVR